MYGQEDPMAPLDPQCDWLRLDLLDAEPKVSRASSESSTPSARGETRFGDYKILGTLGSGGMGVVYRARQHGIDREVAIKSLSQVALIDSTARARFQSELKILGKLRHSNIVQVHESGFDQGVPYLVMEYVAGGTLKDLIQERSPHRRVSELMIEVARAVDWAHGQGIIHRDLKPSNIFLTEAGQPKVADFGIALEIEETQNFT
jgi:serine/threonine protein kinase